jgi:hypothetical protein
VQDPHIRGLDPKPACRLPRRQEDVGMAAVAPGDPIVEDKGAQPFQDHPIPECHAEGVFHIAGEGHHPRTGAVVR